MIEGKNISKDFVSRKIFLLLAIAVILILLGIHFWIKSSSDISVKDAEKQIEENLRAAGVSEYEKIDLQAYEKQAGVDLSKYVSYRFFYTSDDLKIEAFLSAPIDLLGKKKSPCLIYNHGGNRSYGALKNVETTYYAYQFHTICVASNYRGCGKSEGTDAFGGDDVHDVIHLLDLCEKLNSVDTKNINMFGVSRGGMMTYETLREDRRIHKAVVVAGVADCTMNYEEREDMRSLLTELIGGTPEHPYPAALEDAYAAYCYLLEQGWFSEQIIIAGDSAGGGLAMALCHYLKDHGKQLPCGIVAMSPWTDLAASGESYETNFERDPLFGKTRDSLIYNKDYIGDNDPYNAYISPLYGDFRGFPPMLIQVGSYEMLLSDSVDVAAKAREQGVKVRISIYEGMFHIFQMAAKMLPESKRAWVEIGKFIDV